MYVCLCNRYRDSDLREVAQNGVRCAKAAYFALGHGPRCGRCVEFAQGLIDSVHARATAGTAAAAVVSANRE
jgi:bacterioferritin-associated ferredoxin